MTLNQPRPGFSRRTLLVLFCGAGVFLGWYVVNFARRVREEAAERNVATTPSFELKDDNGSQLAIVRNRQRILKEIFSEGGFCHRGDETATIPEVRKRLGDKAQGLIFVPDHHFSLADVDSIREAFPEAEVFLSSLEQITRARREAAEP